MEGQVGRIEYFKTLHVLLFGGVQRSRCEKIERRRFRRVGSGGFLERKKESSSWQLPQGVEIHFASVDCSVENCRKMLAPAVIEEYPTVLLVTADGTEPFVYEGSLHGSQLMRFVREVVMR